MALVYAPVPDLLTCNMSTPLLFVSFSLSPFFPLFKFIPRSFLNNRILAISNFHEWLLACPSCRPSWSALDADDFLTWHKPLLEEICAYSSLYAVGLHPLGTTSRYVDLAQRYSRNTQHPTPCFPIAILVSGHFAHRNPAQSMTA